MKNKLKEAIDFANLIYEDYVGKNRDKGCVCLEDEDCSNECQCQDEIIDSYSLKKDLSRLITLLEEINNE